MRGWITGIALWSLFFAACAGHGRQKPVAVPEGVGPEAVLRVSERALVETAMRECADEGSRGIEGCFLKVMEGLGASPEALRFSASLDSAACMHAFQEAGPVDVGWVYYPFRANERFGCYLLNGSPGLLDVDDPDLRLDKVLKERTRVLSPEEKISQITVWPGDRTGPGRLASVSLPESGLRFIASYVLRDGCHACRTVGSAEIAFDFDDQGSFLGTDVVSLGKVLHTVVGGSVTLALKAPTEAGGRWQAIRLPSFTILDLESKARVPPRPGQKTRTEAWTFRALEPGRVLVTFRHISPDAPSGLPDDLASFLVVIHEDREALNDLLDDVFSPVVEKRLEEMGSPRAGRVVMEVVGVHGDLARVDIRPQRRDTDDRAVVYLRRVNGAWSVLCVARDFDEAFFEEQGVPPELQGPTKIAQPFEPLSADTCSELCEAVSGALKSRGTIREKVPFEDYAGKGFGEACRITWTGTGEDFPEIPLVARSVRTVLEGRGWVEDSAYVADGPLGTAAGFRKEGALILLRVIMEPSEDAGLLSNRPVSIWELLPEERIYAITLCGAKQP